jgi:predicted nucleotidyltransferase
MRGLQQQEWALFGTVFARYPEISRVCVFGSRALGTHRPNSDVDLVAFGEIDRVAAARIVQELESLPLPYLIDFVVYDGIISAPLRQHIDAVAQQIYPLI